MSTSKTISGAKAYFKIADQTGTAHIIAYAQNCSYSDPSSLQAIEVMGLEHVLEHSELGKPQVEFSCSMFRVFNESAMALGLQPTLSEFLKQSELTVDILDKANSNNNTTGVLLKLTGIKLVNRTGNVDARGMFVETLSFVGRILNDETENGAANKEQSVGTIV